MKKHPVADQLSLKKETKFESQANKKSSTTGNLVKTSEKCPLIFEERMLLKGFWKASNNKVIAGHWVRLILTHWHKIRTENRGRLVLVYASLL